MRQHLQPLVRKVVILFIEAFAIGALIALAFLLKPIPVAAPPLVKPSESAQKPISAINPGLTQDKATTVLELFNPSDQSLTHQLNETTIRQQIEQIVATNYVLANCKHIDSTTYRDSFRALIIYAQRTKLAVTSSEAESRVRQIAESASASYSMLYYRTNCNDPKLDTITTQLIAWQKAQLDQ